MMVALRALAVLWLLCAGGCLADPPGRPEQPVGASANDDDVGDDDDSGIDSPSPLCTDTCEFVADGNCDDGGPESDFDVCDYGTDCSDCGPRPPQ
ncbi:MAG: hypothetical protein CMP23_04475 [Rickettsiales bacterium]|nr:hypothetical protein [Rickettsiales bacterium]